MDVDRDAPFAKPGLVHGVSLPLFSRNLAELQDPSKSALFKGTIEGFQGILDNLDRSIANIFFFEGRTAIYIGENHSDLLSKIKRQNNVIGLHGMDHEDLIGTESKIKISLREITSIIAKGAEAVQSVTHVPPRIFRAPYMRIERTILAKLPDLGIRSDSSLYLDTTSAPIPYHVVPGLLEIPVVKYPKSDGKFIYMYLWPLLEQKRPTEDYIHTLIQLCENNESPEEHSFCLINLHPWHISYRITERRYLSVKEINNNLELLQIVLDGIREHPRIHFELPEVVVKEITGY